MTQGFLGLLAAFILPLPLLSQSAGLSLGAGAGFPGDNVTLEVSLVGGSNAAALQWRMSYSSTDLAFVESQPTLLATQAGKSVQCGPSGSETMCVLFGFNTNGLSDGPVALVTFQILGVTGPGARTITLSSGRAASGDGDSIPTTVSDGSITVQQVVNLPPSAADGSATTNEDTPTNVSLVATDPEGDALTYSYAQPAHGVVSGTAPDVLYTPAADFHGQDQFTFQATDTQGQSDSGTVTVTVQPVNDPPSANDQGLTTDEDTPLPIVLSGTDPDGDTLTFAVVSQPSNGLLSGTAPNLTYSPNSQFAGQDQFTFQVSDPQGQSDTATVSITVQPLNDAPSATDQNLTTDEDTPLPIVLSGTDPDGDTLTFAVVSQPTNGLLSGRAPNLTYSPNPQFAGQDLFTFQVSDPQGQSDTATVSITVQPLNDAPSATDQNLTTDEDTSLPIVLSGTDPDGDTLTFAVVSQPTNGLLSGTAPNLVYIPNPDFHGVDALTFSVADGNGQTADGTVSFTVNSVNDAPLAESQSVAVSDGQSVPVLLSASDPDGDALTYEIEIGPSHGVLSGSAPSLTYTPEDGYAGNDSFTFRAVDSEGSFDSAVVSLVVEAEANGPPEATSQDVVTDEDVVVAITLSATDPDGDVLTYSLTAQPTNGSLSGTAPNLVYMPNPDFHGVDALTFSVVDGNGNSDEGTVSFTVTPVNDTPLAESQFVAVSDGQPVPVVLSASDPDGDALTYEIEAGPSHGALSGTAPTLTYTPEHGYAGDDSFTFRAVDPDGSFDSAVVSLAVEAGEPQNSPPEATSQDIATDEDLALEITLSAIDPDDDELAYSVTVQPTSGSLSGVAPILIYTPNQDFNGVDTLTFSVTDGNGHTDEGTVGISVNPVNDLPTTTSIEIETEKGKAVEIHLDAEDADGDPLTFIVQTNPSDGSLSGTAPNLTYTPYDGFIGTDSFDFLVSDTGGESVPGTVTIKVAEVIISRDKPAVFSTSGVWMIDQNADGQFEGPPVDREFVFIADNENIPVIGDWSGSGLASAGVFIDGVWYLDVNGNGVWDGAGIDLLGSLGRAGDIPVVGDWDESGRDQIGVYRKGSWLLDWNGNGQWDGAAIDRQFALGSRSTYPVVGDWTGSGSDRIGVFFWGVWLLDWNGNGRWDGFSVDRFIGLGSWGDTPVVGDWNGSGSDKVGVYERRSQNPRWELDLNGNGVWEGNNGDLSARFGERGNVPVVGDWDGSGKMKIGVFDEGSWLLDFNGNGVWDGETVDGHAVVGGPGDNPVVGRW